MNEIVGQHKYH